MIESLSAEIIPDGGSGRWEVFLGETGESSEDTGFALRRTDFLEDGGRGASGSLAFSISIRRHSGIWAEALQERSFGYSGCLE